MFRFISLLGVSLALALANTSAATESKSNSPTSDAGTVHERQWRRPIDVFERNSRSFDDQPAGLELSEIKISLDNDPRYAAQNFDDSAWTTVSSYQNLPARTGIYWARFRVRQSGPLNFVEESLQITIAASYRIYWDGILIGNSGVPADNEAQEVAGPLDVLYTIPPQARGPGEHVVALQLSAYGNRFPERQVRVLCFFGSPAALQAKLMMQSAVPVAGAVALLMLALSSWVIWIIGVRHSALSWFSAMCTCAALFQGVLALRFITGYPYTWAYPMILIRSALMGAMGLCLVFFVAGSLSRKYRTLLAGAVLVAFTVAVVFFENNPTLQGAVMLQISCVVALILSCRAWLRSRNVSDGLIVAGIAMMTFFVIEDPWSYSSPGFFPKFVPTELCLMAVLGVRVQRERRRLHEMQLKSARLEIELLKKNLQPHFLFNTLTAVSEVIEQSPSTAVALIEDLADEFRALTRLSGEKLIPLEQEIELCHTHLRIVSRRMGLALRLEVLGQPDHLVIPPAIFLTLIENSFAHQAIAGSDGRFTLTITRAENLTTFRFFSPGEIVPHPERPLGGTGLKYLRARLEESFPHRWNFSDSPARGGWESLIEVRK